MAYLVGFLIIWGVLSVFKKKYFENKHISKHKKWSRENADYSKYLKWCEKNNEIPMPKYQFLNPLDSLESKYNELTKEL